MNETKLLGSDIVLNKKCTKFTSKKYIYIYRKEMVIDFFIFFIYFFKLW